MDDETLPGEDMLLTSEQTVGSPSAATTRASFVYEDDTEPTARESPSRIGGYRLDELLGRGGMGEVHLGYDQRLDRPVAVKLLREGRRDQGRARALMEREAKALAKLSHPNVVHVYEIGEHDGQIFIAMEYVEGRTLRAFLQQTPRPRWREIVAVFIEAGRGLLAAHEVGIVHRDFKPDNVIIGTDGHPRVLDFGIARHGRDESPSQHEDGAAPTDAGASGVAGTLRYMPLEQFLHTGEGPAADQFAFCVALYEALWARDPFPAQSIGQRVLAIEEEAFVAPPRGQVERALWPIVRRGLRAQPADRWPSMRALLAALERVLTRRRRRALLAAGASLLGVGVVLGGLGPSENPCASLEQQLSAQWDDARGDRLEATLRELASTRVAADARAEIDDWYRSWTGERLQLCRTRLSLPEQTHADRLACLEVQRKEVDTLVDSLDPTSPAPLSRAFASLPDSELCRSASWSRLEQPSPAIADQVQRLREQIARASGQRRAGRVQQSRGLLEPARAQARELGFAPLVIESELAWAQVLLDSGDWAAAATVLEAATLRAEAIAHEWAMVESREQLARANIWLERPERARIWLDLAYAAQSRIAAAPERLVPLIWFEARLELIDGRPERALELLEPLIAKLPTTEHPIAYFELLAEIRTAVDDDEGALRALEEGHERAVRDWGADYPDTLRLLPGLGFALDAAGRSDEARGLLEQAAVGLAALPEEPDLLIAQAMLGKLELDRGELELAQRWFLAAEQTFIERELPNPPQLAQVELALGLIAYLQDDFEQAQARFAACQARYAEHASDDPGLAHCELGRGLALLTQQEFDEAARAFESALARPESMGARLGACLGLAEIELRRANLEGAALHLAELAAARDQLSPLEQLNLMLLEDLLALRSHPRDRCPTRTRTSAPELDDADLVRARRMLDRLQLTEAERRCLGWPA